MNTGIGTRPESTLDIPTSSISIEADRTEPAHNAADIDQAVDYYLAEANTDVALRFVDAVERVVGQIGRSPQAGSLRFSYELEIPGLRVHPLSGFPYLVFYVVGDESVNVLRILHARQDIPSAMEGEIGT